jgi:glycosyltransferase involved in cell wall biosynthesis
VHVCLSSIEFFGFGVHGGFGRATRFIGRELVRRGVKVTIIVPRRARGYPATCQLDGMTIHQFNPLAPWSILALYRACGADIYHSQDASLGTFLALKAMPGRKHVITFRDPMDQADWEIENRYSGKAMMGWRLYHWYIDNTFVRSAVGHAHGLYCSAQFLIPKVLRIYKLSHPPGFLPTPVAIPDAVRKDGRPTVCFVSRWEGRKRPELFFELARKFPGVDFIAVGGAQDTKRDRWLRNTYAGIPNLQMTGIINQFTSGALGEILSKSWVLVNTSPREGLPNAFLEAAAHRCALLSYTDPDHFASRFGVHVGEGDLESGLDALLSNSRWKKLGEGGCEYVRGIFSVERAMSAHLEAYERIRCGDLIEK